MLQNRIISAFVLCLAVLFSISACSSNEDGDKPSSSGRLLPQASLVPHEILVVIDEDQWQGLLGQAIRDVFARPMPGLPQSEAWFKLRQIKPSDLRGFLKRYPNIIFAFTLDNKSKSSEVLKTMFSTDALKTIQGNPDRYRMTKKDEFARGQEVLYLFGKTETELIGRLYTQQEELLNYFNTIERNRYIKEFASVKINKVLRDQIAKKYDISLKLPAGYEVAKQDDNFLWLRLLDQKVDKSMWLTWKPYKSKQDFAPDSILAFRNEVVKNYVWGDDSTSYMRLEMREPIESDEVNFNGSYGVQVRGLWRLEKIIMGGPFVGLAFVDEARQRFYYLEGFTYAPGQDKKAAISELEAMLWSAKPTPVKTDSAATKP